MYMKKKMFKDDELKMPEETFGGGQAKPSYIGIILGLLILALIMILAGLYLWSEMLQKQVQAPAITSTRPTAAMNKEPESTNSKADTETMQAMSTSDEIDAIQADLDSTNVDQLDADIPAIDAEMSASSTQ